ncbi:hypothetical protein [Priestia megaterium]|uniref:hypothetical protein n=1 Tax=Priestia megaterium TaxID=1404 RepID=UPI0021D69D89|nr:hypothetical protein [Priestia megaterium]MCU7741478.1 hypothetical protein [Priestia megaterium]
MITIKKYYWDYNPEDDSYYVDESYPQYGNYNSHKKNKEHEKICFNINIHNNLANQGGNAGVRENAETGGQISGNAGQNANQGGQNANQEGQVASEGGKNKLKEFNLEEEMEDE